MLFLLYLVIGLAGAIAESEASRFGANQVLTTTYQKLQSNASGEGRQLDGGARVPEYMRQLHALHRKDWRRLVVNIGGRARQLGVITSIRSHSHLASQPTHRKHEYLLRFNNSLSDGDEVEVARELRLYSRRPFQEAGRLRLYDLSYLKEKDTLDIVDNTTLLGNRYSIYPVSEVFIRGDSDRSLDGNWISFDIRQLRRPPNQSSTYLLQIDSTRHGSRRRYRRSVQLPADKLLDLAAPHLVTFNRHRRVPRESSIPRQKSPSSNHQKRRKRRQKRRRGNRKEWRRARRLSHTYCRIRSLYVDFEAIGWNTWIVAPQGYNANMCQGGCPFPLDDNFEPTNHAIIQQLVHFYRPGNVVPPCCVPTKLAPESLLYFDDSNQVVLKVYEDMSVVRCGCR